MRSKRCCAFRSARWYAWPTLIVAWRHGYRFSQARPIDAIGQIAPRPVFLIHGVDDSLVPVSHVRRLYAAAREPRLVWEVPGA
ncbi:MAG: hypothetical protein KatS3mg056_2918 [Chloroflexus sp.]|nr:MAG: hypothetical protein KatS3mg056_2918 [Chloroflexus sp.]